MSARDIQADALKGITADGRGTSSGSARSFATQTRVGGAGLQPPGPIGFGWDALMGDRRRQIQILRAHRLPGLTDRRRQRRFSLWAMPRQDPSELQSRRVGRGGATTSGTQAASVASREPYARDSEPHGDQESMKVTQ